MFEKSLYDLIRGMRHHKGNEREYIQNALRECRAEIRGSDMDLKATAILKLVYLEMFGHDMSWASFNVLEVMSSPKYPQKRVGYLSAVQSFRPDTEVLMLATNLLKKDITSAAIPTISLPLITLPHVVTPSLAMSLQSDLMPRLTHSSPNVRKKTVVTLYRLALVYPETLRLAWPKIKDILMDDEQDPSVTAAVVNVVCELGWRRPQDFLALAPRLFDLLVDSGNNWMAIKIIKLFATLTPLEPRLVKKLLPPLTTLIRTTPAMSLLYECIHGIIQGGILESQENFRERDEVAQLCVEKLRGMIAVDRDPNLKYVALLAFRNIVKSHPELVAENQDVILDCINDPDISIRLQALELGSGMISMDNIVVLVDRLLQQLRDAPLARGNATAQDAATYGIEPVADDGEDVETTLKADRATDADMSPVPPEYQDKIIRQVLVMCSKDSYANVPDFEWYVDVLVELVRLAPASSMSNLGANDSSSSSNQDIGTTIGIDLQNAAVRVSSVRAYAVRAAAGLVSSEQSQLHFPGPALASQGVLAYAAWLVGEYAKLLNNKQAVLESLLSFPVHDPTPAVYCAYIQAIPKLLGAMFSAESYSWSAQQQTMSTLLLARVIHFLEGLVTHSSLDVQERAVEFLELLKVTKEAMMQHSTDHTEPPYLVTHVIPSLFNESELGPVAASAQSKVPLPDNLDLTKPFNESLMSLLQDAERDSLWDQGFTDSHKFYYEKPRAAPRNTPSASSLLNSTSGNSSVPSGSSYQVDDDVATSHQESLGHEERRLRLKDDPFYIGAETYSPGRTPVQEVVRANNGDGIDIDAIPIMDLDLGEAAEPTRSSTKARSSRKLQLHHQPRQHVSIAAEETLEDSDTGSKPHSASHSRDNTRTRIQTRLLQVDSSGLGGFSLNEDGSNRASSTHPYSSGETEEAEMAKALAEVERLRMEMQRASERLHLAEGIPDDGTLVKKKKKKKAKEVPQDAEDGSLAITEEKPKKKKKKKKKVAEIEA